MERFTSRFLMVVDEVFKDYPAYAKESYYFVYEALNYASKVLSKQDDQHLSGIDLMYNGIVPLAKNRWGCLAEFVLAYWGIHSGKDLGKIIELLVKVGIFYKSESDNFEDFSKIDINTLFKTL